MSISSIGFGSAALDEEDLIEARLLPLDALSARFRERSDIFTINSDRRMFPIESVCLLCAVAAGSWVSTHVDLITTNDFIGNDPIKERPLGIAPDVEPPHPAPVNRPVNQISARRNNTMHRSAPARATASGSSGVGTIHARITGTGLFAALNGKVMGKIGPGESSDLPGMVTATGIDAFLNGNGRLKSGSGGGGRRTEGGMGFGAGYGSSGFGGSGGDGMGMDDIDRLMNPSIPDLPRIQHIPPVVKVLPPEIGKSLPGGRSKASIMRILLENMPGLRYAYNRWLGKYPSLKGKITVKFAIDEYGNVIDCSLIETGIGNQTLGDKTLSQQVISMISRWKFDKIDKVGDITEVVFPLVFTM